MRTARGDYVESLEAKLAAYRDAFRRAFVAYLVTGHGQSDAAAKAEAERVMAETDRRLEAGA